MKGVWCILTLLLFVNGWLEAQNYNRSSVSVVLTSYQDSLQDEVLYNFSDRQLGERYDKNVIATKSLVLDCPRIYKLRDSLTGEETIESPDRREMLTKILNEQNVALQVIGCIFNRQPDGLMNMEVVNERAAYNKTDKEYEILQATAKNIAGLREGGEALIRNSYLMVFDYANLRYEYVESESASDEDYYWKASPAVYLFQVDFTDELRQRFYEECWMDEETPEADRAVIRERFDAFRIPVKFVMRLDKSSDVKTGIVRFLKKTEEEKGNMTEEDLQYAALSKLVKTAFSSLSDELEQRYEPFRIKTAVDAVKPVRAKIGLKEGLSTNHRFFMYENRISKSGREFRRRMGVIRATNKITDNRQITTGDTKPTEFYQIAGKAAQVGWDMEERKSWGINVEAGYQLGNLEGIALNITGTTYGRKSLNHYFMLDFVYGIDTYKFEWWSKKTASYVKSVDYKLETVNFGYGYGLMLRNWEFYPYVGIGCNILDGSEQENKDGKTGVPLADSDERTKVFFAEKENEDGNGEPAEEKESSDMKDNVAWTFNAGIRTSLNIWYPIQIFGAVEYSAAVYKGENYEILCADKEMDDASSGVHFKFGLRYCF